MYLILLFIVTAAWLSYGLYLLYRDTMLAKHGETINARVTGHETSSGTTFYPLLSYTFQGRYHEVRYHIGDKNRFDSSVPLPIRVLPSAPRSTQVLAPISTRSSIKTPPSCGNGMYSPASSRT